MNWNGVIPAVTTPFSSDLSVDLAFFARHCAWLVENGCSGVVVGGSLGEGATLTFEEKESLVKTAVEVLGGRASVVFGVSALSTDESVRLMKMGERAGCDGFMLLPPYVYTGDWREMREYVSTNHDTSMRPIMLYNNPIAYKTDFLPWQVAELAERCPRLEAIKESSADVRRIAALRSLLGDRIRILCGVDDLIVEAALAGATGWIAGLVNAFPAESVALFEAALRGDKARAFEIYKWFLPLLRMDVVPKFVQLIKLAQEEVGMGSARVRGPRMELVGEELAEARATIACALAARP